MTSAEDQPASGGKNDTKDPTAPTISEAAPEAEAATSSASAPDEPNAADAADEQRPSDKSQPSSKKRRSNIQLNKDDHPEGHGCSSDDDDELNDDGGKRSEPFKRASEDVLKKRKIVKASTKWSSGGNGENNGGGAFASVMLAPTGVVEKSENADSSSPSVFGSSAKLPTFGSTTGTSGFGSAAAKPGGFGSGFGGVSSGFGASKSDSKNGGDANTSSPKSSAFGGGFGAVSTGFGSLKSTSNSFGFGSSSNANPAPSLNDAATASNGSGLAGTFAKSPNKSANSSPSKFPTSSVVDTANGEQDEDCLIQVRAKLFKMVPEDENPATEEDSSKLKGDVPSVPSSSGRMELVRAKREENEGSPEKASESPEKEGEDEEKPKLVQKEAGIGPVRVLKRKPPLGLGKEEKEDLITARVVQRQETSGGQATKVILNVRLVPKTCNVIRRGDKYVQLNAPNSDGTLESSLFKVKMTAEADKLEKNLKAMLEVE